MKPYLQFMNATRRADRPQCLPDSGRGTELHPRRSAARHITVFADHTIRRLEAKLAVRLLTRTTRSAAPTEAGERLLGTLRPALDSIGAELASLSELREKPAGTIRITTSEHAAHTVLWPTLERLLPSYPDVHVELSIDFEPDRHRSSVSGCGRDAAQHGVRSRQPCWPTYRSPSPAAGLRSSFRACAGFRSTL